MSEATTVQPMPVINDQPMIVALVQQDLADRAMLGVEKYGTRLQPFNGRRALWDAYQEVLDMAQYIRQEIWEREELERELTRLRDKVAALPLVIER